jgi:hypothetical protein
VVQPFAREVVHIGMIAPLPPLAAHKVQGGPGEIWHQLRPGATQLLDELGGNEDVGVGHAGVRRPLPIPHRLVHGHIQVATVSTAWADDGGVSGLSTFMGNSRCRAGCSEEIRVREQ